jgi:hypothetical protein
MGLFIDFRLVGKARAHALDYCFESQEQFLPLSLVVPQRDYHFEALYGGPISQSIKRLLRRLAALPAGKYELQRKPAARRLGYGASTIDWLTNQKEARQSHPERQAMARTNARARARRVGLRTPISKSWQFGAVGKMLAVHSHEYPIYVQLTLAGFTLRWRLAVQKSRGGRGARQAGGRCSIACTGGRQILA